MNAPLFEDADDIDYFITNVEPSQVTSQWIVNTYSQSAKKRIFITTSDFSKGAIDYVTRIDSKIILVSGARLTELMIEHNVSVTSVAKYEVKKIDSDYFIED